MPASVFITGNGTVGAVYAQAVVNGGCEVDFPVRKRENPNAMYLLPLLIEL